MVIYEDIGVSRVGIEMVRAYSDQGVLIECDGVLYEVAEDPKSEKREYIETDIPIREKTATTADYEQALDAVGVNV